MEGRDDFIKELFQKKYEQLIRKGYRLTGDMQRAQDLVQETFLSR